MGKWEEIDHFEVSTKESAVPKSKGKEVLEAAVYVAAGNAAINPDEANMKTRVLSGKTKDADLFLIDVTDYFVSNNLGKLIGEIETHGKAVQNFLPINADDVPAKEKFKDLPDSMKKQQIIATIILVVFGLLLVPIIYLIFRFLGLN
jgi:hypothetical protein